MKKVFECKVLCFSEFKNKTECNNRIDLLAEYFGEYGVELDEYIKLCKMSKKEKEFFYKNGDEIDKNGKYYFPEFYQKICKN